MIATAQRSFIPPQALIWGLLLANGFLIALMLALAKAATSQGMPAVTYAFWQTLIAGAVLLLCSQKRRSLLERRLTRYFLISGLTGIAIPNVIGFYLVTKLGAGFTGIMYALPNLYVPARHQHRPGKTKLDQTGWVVYCGRRLRLDCAATSFGDQQPEHSLDRHGPDYPGDAIHR